MDFPRIGSQAARIAMDTTRLRQTTPEPSPFKTFLQTGAAVLLTGAQVATNAIGIPALSAAVARARVGADASAASVDPNGAAGGLTPNGRLDDDMRLLKMQDEIQRHNRQVTLVSNVMKAQHETAKGTIGNIRS